MQCRFARQDPVAAYEQVAGPFLAEYRAKSEDELARLTAAQQAAFITVAMQGFYVIGCSEERGHHSGSSDGRWVSGFERMRMPATHARADLWRAARLYFADVARVSPARAPPAPGVYSYPPPCFIRRSRRK